MKASKIGKKVLHDVANFSYYWEISRKKICVIYVHKRVFLHKQWRKQTLIIGLRLILSASRNNQKSWFFCHQWGLMTSMCVPSWTKIDKLVLLRFSDVPSNYMHRFAWFVSPHCKPFHFIKKKGKGDFLT